MVAAAAAMVGAIILFFGDGATCYGVLCVVVWYSMVLLWVYYFCVWCRSRYLLNYSIFSILIPFSPFLNAIFSILNTIFSINSIFSILRIPFSPLIPFSPF